MRAQLAVIAALLCVAALAWPTRTQRVNDAEFPNINASVVACDQGQDSIRPTRDGTAHRKAHSIKIDVFPSVSAPAGEAEPQTLSAPGVHAPGQTIHPPAEHGPTAPSQPRFSPRLQPPNGKTDGKIYPA
jgi:hypothetical protein